MPALIGLQLGDRPRDPHAGIDAVLAAHRSEHGLVVLDILLDDGKRRGLAGYPRADIPLEGLERGRRSHEQCHERADCHDFSPPPGAHPGHPSSFACATDISDDQHSLIEINPECALVA